MVVEKIYFLHQVDAYFEEKVNAIMLADPIQVTSLFDK